MYSVWGKGEEQGSGGQGILRLGEWIDFIDRFDKIRGRTSIRYAHIYIFLKIAYMERKLVSRYYLMNILGLSEASTRTFLKKMVKLKVAKPVKGGHHLSRYGIKLAKLLTSIITEFSIDKGLEVDNGYGWGVGLAIRYIDNMLYRLRDDVIRYGGKAALILLLKDGELIFPESRERLSAYNPILNDIILNEIGGFPAKFIIISFADNVFDARLSSLDTALKYITSL